MFWNEDVETLDRAELQKLQLSRLRATLAGRVDRADIEVRALPIVANEERLARLEPPI